MASARAPARTPDPRVRRIRGDASAGRARPSAAVAAAESSTTNARASHARADGDTHAVASPVDTADAIAHAVTGAHGNDNADDAASS